MITLLLLTIMLFSIGAVIIGLGLVVLVPILDICIGIYVVYLVVCLIRWAQHR